MRRALAIASAVPALGALLLSGTPALAQPESQWCQSDKRLGSILAQSDQVFTAEVSRIRHYDHSFQFEMHTVGFFYLKAVTALKGKLPRAAIPFKFDHTFVDDGQEFGYEPRKRDWFLVWKIGKDISYDALACFPEIEKP